MRHIEHRSVKPMGTVRNKNKRDQDQAADKGIKGTVPESRIPIQGNLFIYIITSQENAETKARLPTSYITFEITFRIGNIRQKQCMSRDRSTSLSSILSFYYLPKPSGVNFPRPTSNKVPTIARTILRKKRSAVMKIPRHLPLASILHR